MILPTMTDEQRINELMADFRSFWTRFTRETVYKWDKAALKQNKFPKIYHWSDTSKNNNKINIMGYITGRKAVRTGYVSIMYTTMRTYKGTWMFLFINNGGEFIYVFPPHALDRYRERLGLDFSDTEIIDYYINKQVQSNGGGETTLLDGKCILATDDGIWMGNQLFGDNYIFKTFVDNSLLRDSQLEEGDNCKNDIEEYLDVMRKHIKEQKSF